MLVQDVMTRDVITVSSTTPVAEAQRIMKENNFRRLPVVDGGKLVGLVTEPRLEQIKPRTSTPLLWQLTYLISHTSVGDVMRKKIVTVKPTDTVEQAIGKAQAAKVGTVIVVDKTKVVGICTTNDFFYKIVNPTLGIGEGGIRILVPGDDIGQAARKIVDCVNKLGIKIKVLWGITATSGEHHDIILHLDTEEADKVVPALEKVGCTVSLVAR
ncbi:MAG: CBS domain-containing protein [Chloroflexota bacterium]